jgi:hypothetical protein
LKLWNFTTIFFKPTVFSGLCKQGNNKFKLEKNLLHM